MYSLGCTLYYAVTGKAPFPGGDTTSKIRRHLEATPLHPCNFNPNLSEEFVDIIADMMEKDPRKRIQTMTEVAARLEAWVTTDVPFAQTTITRGPWLAPPPPILDTGLGTDPASGKIAPARNPSGDESMQDTSFASGTNSVNRNQATNAAPPPPQLQLGSETIVQNAQMSKAMLIGMTIAIVLPPALVIGMILGYLIAAQF